MLGMSLAAANSALSRARATLGRVQHEKFAPGLAALNADQTVLLARYVRAWESRDIDALVALLAEEASFSMPPYPTWFEGHPAITAALRGRVFANERQFRLLPTVASGQPAFAVFKRESGQSSFEPHGIQIVWIGAK